MLNVESKIGVVNLFADYILSNIGKDTETIISVIMLDDFFIYINGITNTNTILNLETIKENFEKEYPYICEKTKFSDVKGILDLIKYDRELIIESTWNRFYKNERPLFNPYSLDFGPQNTLQVQSTYPFGYGLPAGRDLLYYSEYIAHNIINHIYSNKIDLKISKELVNIEDKDIEIRTYSDFLSEYKIKSLILDIFDFDFVTFNDKIKSYDIMKDSLEPVNVFDKPWLIRDKHPKDLIIF
jgi:hypothetical protein